MLTPLLKRALILGAVVYVLSLIFTLPARVLSDPLARRGIHASNYSGSLWHGRAQNLQIGVMNIGQVEWRWRFLPLFTGKLAADIDIIQPDGQATGRVATTLSGKLILTNLKASLPLQNLIGSNGLPGGWTAKAQLHFDTIQFENRWPIHAKGTLDVMELTGPSSSPKQWGSYRLNFPAQGSNAQTLIGTLSDSPDAALSVAGTLTFTNNRSYVLDARVAGNDRSPQDFANQLKILGPADGNGRYPLSIAGSF